MSLQRFRQKLPRINAWIAATVDAHAGSARRVESLGFARLPSFFSWHVLACTRVVEVHELPIPPLTALGLPEFADFEGMNANGITYGDLFFVRSGHAQDESVYFHELVHALQWQHLGPEDFLIAYALGLSTERGYHTNPIETLAYELQARFDAGSAPFDVNAEVARRLDDIVPLLMAGAVR